ncbi:hypothetical protein D1AOALGA4SA_3084 [Olavius algarvensis Delta 1 endosymbiont]|nr:hypothetical protein D1AOALGA4SA_3084 [Olavius algarvensis Delta 1 endosymbiont]
MKRLFGLALAGLLFLGVFSAPAAAGRDIVKVMTRNQYLGADLEPLLLALAEGSPAVINDAALEVLAQIEANNFPLRAWRFATEVALTKPHLIGLQEVIKFDITPIGQNEGSTVVDHLDLTLAALDFKGQRYDEAATVNNLDITITLDTDENQVPDLEVRVLDRDVILFRDDDDVGYPTIVDLCEDQNLDGCTYTNVVLLPNPLNPNDPIPIKRGFVGVDATVRGKKIRFVNTHLEGAGPTDPISGRSIQSLQAEELVEKLTAANESDRPLILLGDFNSSPEDSGDFSTPYQIIVGAGLADIWDKNFLKFFDWNGFTCCQDKDLLNTTSLLDERIDIIFVRDTSFLPLAFVTGRVPILPLSQPPNWASDHGGVFGKLIFRRSARH